QLDLCGRLLAGRPPGAEVAAQRALAEWCLHHGRRPAAAAKGYAAALLAQPSLAGDLEAGNRFDAACAAALAGCGVGKDAGELEDGTRAALRWQALDWLTAEYNAWANLHRRGKPGDRTAAATAVRSWQQNEYLAGVRDEKSLARLPCKER